MFRDINSLATRLWRAAAFAVLAAVLVLGSADTAWAQKKKKAVEVAPSKSYTLPYAVVIAVLGIGLMTVCRPTTRLEKASDRLQEKEEDS